MGKYSLENHEMYPTKIVRPNTSHVNYSGESLGKYKPLRCSWSVIESERGISGFEELSKDLKNHENVLLEIVDEAPDWVRENREIYFAAFIRQVARFVSGNKHVSGILVTNESDDKDINEAYIEAFDESVLILDISDEHLLDYFQNKKVRFGLLLHVDNEHYMKSSENLARYALTENWKKSPIFISNQEGNDEVFIEEAKRWHGTYALNPIGLGYKFEVRRVTYPVAVSSRDVLPLRIWIVNSGVSPCYETIRIKIRISNNKMLISQTLDHNPKLNALGDIIHNEIIQLPELDIGTYMISIGLFTDENEIIDLSLPDMDDDGFYEMGTVEIEGEGKYHYSTIWDHYYPEGYYPLEDPKAPEGS